MAAPLRFTLDGATYEFDQSRMSIGEARLIKRYAGLGYALWESQLGLLDPDAVAVMILIAKRRAGEQVEWPDLAEVDLEALVKTFERDREPGKESDEDTDEQPTVIS